MSIEGKKHINIGMKIVKRDIKSQTTADVVRCKDCKHFMINKGDSLGYCTCQKIPVKFGGEIFPTEDFYCDYGERNENGKS